MLASAATAALAVTALSPLVASADDIGPGPGRLTALRPSATGSAGATSSATRVIVKYRSGTDTAARVRSLSAQGLGSGKALPLTGAMLVDVPRGEDAADVASDLSRDPNVEYAVPDVLRRPLATRAPAPDDPLFGYQWGLDNSGTPLPADASAPTPVAGVDVDALGAWAVHRGVGPVLVAVIDQGIDLTHPDLEQAIWTNPGEIPDNGIDDDHNGYVDDVHGWDFVHNEPAGVDTVDDVQHGTHVAGIIGATADNGQGVAGLAAGVTILPVKFIADDGGYDSDAIKAIAYAKALGARVMNASWGVSEAAATDADNPALRDAVSNCGCVFVSAAGNDGVDIDTAGQRVYPAAFGLSNELSVAAVDDSGRLASFDGGTGSNYGVSSVDLAAPGQAVASTLPGNAYGWGDGTSMAVPFVSATAALMLSAAPTLTPAQIVQRLKATVRPLSSLTGKVATGGMLDAGAAMRDLLAHPVPPQRLAGSDRYATAAQVAGQFPVGTSVAYVASGTSFPDALAGAALAGSLHAPVLLTAKGSLPQATKTALTRLRPRRIVVLGGTGAVSAAVATALKAYTAGGVSRLSGADRYATAAAIAQAMVGAVGTPDTVYVASGASFPDALAGSALAGHEGQPVLLTSPTSLSTAAASWLSGHRPGRIVVLGGSGAVSDAVLARLGSYTGGTVSRLAGGDRFATAAAVAAAFGAKPAGSAYVADGLAFPDALAGAALAGTRGAPVLLVSPKAVPSATATAIRSLAPWRVIVLGGTGAVSASTALKLSTLQLG